MNQHRDTVHSIYQLIYIIKLCNIIVANYSSIGCEFLVLWINWDLDPMHIATSLNIQFFMLYIMLSDIIA